MEAIEDTVGNALVEWLGADKVDDLKDQIVKVILEQVRSDLRDQYDLTIDVGLIADISNEAFEEVSKKIKKMYKDKYLEVAEEAIKKVKVNGRIEAS